MNVLRPTIQQSLMGIRPPKVTDNCAGTHATKDCPGTVYFLPGETEEDIVRVKAMENFKLQRLPRDAGDFKS